MKNTLEVNEFIGELLYWNLIGYFFYRNVLLRSLSSLNGLATLQSHLILLSLITSIIVLNLLLSIKWCRNVTSAVVTALIPYGLYTLIIYKRYIPKVDIICTVSVVAVIILALTYLATNFYIYTHYTHSKRKKCKIQVARAFYINIRNTAALIAIVVLIAVFVRVHFVENISTSRNITPSDEKMVNNFENSGYSNSTSIPI